VEIGIKQAMESVKDLEKLIIAYNYQAPIYIKDIATIEKSYDIQHKKEAYIYLKDENGNFGENNQITLSASKLKGSN
ncbi:AcrB/AcrD/AcrF family protein, partial [Aliarcobacter butzleri]